MKKRILSLLMSVLMLGALMLPAAAVSAEPVEYDVVISGFGISESGEYIMNVLGNLKGTFGEGENEMRYGDILDQNLTIVGFNTVTGASNTFGIGTVYSIVVTVTDGEITNVEIKGPVQTKPGNFDTYTVNCSVYHVY